MGISLRDRETREFGFHVNVWHWRAVVERIRRLEVLPNARVDALHAQFASTGLTREEARSVASAIRNRLLPTLSDAERLLLDGTRTTKADQGFNYSTNRKVLAEFVAYCESCGGFDVL